jgi:sugar phosphate isomerase/epimerase
MSNDPQQPVPDRWPLSVFADEIDPDLDAQVAAMRACRVGAVEFRAAWGSNVLDLSDAELARAASSLREAGIAVAAIGSPVGKAPIAGDPGDELGRLRQAFAAAERLGTRLIRVFSYYVDGAYEEHRDEVLRRLSAWAAEASAAGFVLVHENESHIYGDTPDRCHDLLSSVGSPALRAAFDPANFVQVEVAEPVTEAWPLLREYVAHVHIKDAVAIDRTGLDPYPASVPPDRLMGTVRPAGQGRGQVPELLAALADSGYDGYLSLEPHLTFTYPDLDGPARFELAVAALRSLL